MYPIVRIEFEKIFSFYSISITMQTLTYITKSIYTPSINVIVIVIAKFQNTTMNILFLMFFPFLSKPSCGKVNWSDCSCFIFVSFTSRKVKKNLTKGNQLTMSGCCWFNVKSFDDLVSTFCCAQCDFWTQLQLKNWISIRKAVVTSAKKYSQKLKTKTKRLQNSQKKKPTNCSLSNCENVSHAFIKVA